MLKPSQRDRLRKEQGRQTRKGDNTDIVKVLLVAALFSAAFLFLEVTFLLAIAYASLLIFCLVALAAFDFQRMTDDGRQVKDFHLCIFALFAE